MNRCKYCPSRATKRTYARTKNIERGGAIHSRLSCDDHTDQARQELEQYIRDGAQFGISPDAYEPIKLEPIP